MPLSYLHVSFLTCLSEATPSTHDSSSPTVSSRDLLESSTEERMEVEAAAAAEEEGGENEEDAQEFQEPDRIDGPLPLPEFTEEQLTMIRDAARGASVMQAVQFIDSMLLAIFPLHAPSNMDNTPTGFRAFNMVHLALDGLIGTGFRSVQRLGINPPSLPVLSSTPLADAQSLPPLSVAVGQKRKELTVTDLMETSGNEGEDAEEEEEEEEEVVAILKKRLGEKVNVAKTPTPAERFVYFCDLGRDSEGRCPESWIDTLVAFPVTVVHSEQHAVWGLNPLRPLPSSLPTPYQKDEANKKSPTRTKARSLAFVGKDKVGDKAPKFLNFAVRPFLLFICLPSVVSFLHLSLPSVGRCCVLSSSATSPMHATSRHGRRCTTMGTTSETSMASTWSSASSAGFARSRAWNNGSTRGHSIDSTRTVSPILISSASRPRQSDMMRHLTGKETKIVSRSGWSRKD